MRNNAMMEVKMGLRVMLLILTVCIIGQNVYAKTKPVKISGTANVEIFPKVNLYKLERGGMELIAQTTVTEDGKYDMEETIEKEGMYAIGRELNTIALYFNNDIHEIYLKPGDKITMNLAKNKSEFVGKLSEENQALDKWYKMIRPFQNKFMFRSGGKIGDLGPASEALVAEIPAILNETKTKNAKFNKVFESLVKFEWANAALYRFNYQSVYTLPEGYPSLEKLYDDYYVSDAAMDVPNGLGMIHKFIIFKLKGKKDFQLEDAVKVIKGDEIRREFIYDVFRRWGNVDVINEEREKFKEYLSTPASQERLKEILAEAKIKGDEQTLTTIDDKQVKLAQFKGKLVVIDYWATWCGGCIMEHPHWKAMYEQYKDNDQIEFVSISMDSDYKAWKEYEEKHKAELVGHRLHGTPSFELLKKYNVRFYPRFMLIGKDGNMINSDVARPSNPSFKALIEKHI